MSGIHNAHAARRRRQRQELEEEAMTPYTPQDLDRWEFKIIRGSFRDPEFTAAVLDQEALAGWELVETFDDTRLRLKRMVTARQLDQTLPKGIDPYRTQYGPSENQIAFLILGITLAVFLAAGLFTLLFAESTSAWLIFTPIIALALGVVGIFVSRLFTAGG